jgi:Fe-S oxidoreductase
LTRQAKTWLQRHPQTESTHDKVVLFADSFTNYGHSEHGLALIKILHRLGIEVAVSACVADGRAALSQGLIPTAQEQAVQTYRELEAWINRGYTVLVIEPSVYALFESDYLHLLREADFRHLKEHSMEAITYLEHFLSRRPQLNSNVFKAPMHVEQTVFFHGHCQQRSLGFAMPTQRLLASLGYRVLTSSVECCGMAGSFGYKEDYFPISERLGKQLVDQIQESVGEHAHPIVLASGTSCLEQLQAFGNTRPIHPLIFLESLLVD